MTKLVVHYAPGILATLKRTIPGGNRHFTIVAVHLLKDDEATWVLEQSWIREKAPTLPCCQPTQSAYAQW